jgi:STE24 endopeptidase
VAGSLLLALAAAELGARALTPRDAPPRSSPADLERYFTADEVSRGRRYARPQMVLALARAAVDLSSLVLVLRRGAKLFDRLPKNPVIGDSVASAGLATALSLPSLPLTAVSRRRAIRVGLVTQSWRGWAGDLAKANAIQAVMAAVGGAAVMAIIRRYPRSWWLPAAGGSVLVGSALAALAPVILDPIFNDFTSLPEGETRRDVLDLAAAAGVKVRGVYSIDASRRTTAANAYVTGFGPTKRVVLFDTLLDRYSREEIRVVVAHELAHVRHRDVPRGVIYAGLVAPAAALAVQRLSWWLSPVRDEPAALPALALAAAIVTAPIGLIGNRLSRAIERRADAFSLELAKAPEAFVSFERAIALQNVADLQPPGWVSRLLATHPPTAERIGMAVSYREAAEASSGNGRLHR